MSVLVLLLPPDRLGLDPRTPFAQIVAFRPSLAAATMVLSVFMLMCGRAWPSAAALMVVGILAAVRVLLAPSLALNPPLAAGSSPYR